MEKYFLIEKSHSQIIKTIMTNIVKMLTDRNLLNKTKLQENIKKITSIQSDSLTYKINTDKYTKDSDKVFSIKIIEQKITAINKASGILDFLVNNEDNSKIIIVNDISNKALKHIHNNYPNTEVFLEEELMINVLEHDYQPEFMLLSNEEGESVMKSYLIKNKLMPKILKNDPISKYFNAKPTQIFRIIRPSETSGNYVTYRLVK